MKPITFLFPTLAEIPKNLRKHYQPKQPLSPTPHKDVFFARIGMGEYSKTNVQSLSQHLSGHTIVLIGYGGGLSPTLAAGEMVMCTTLHTDNQPKIELITEIDSQLLPHNIKQGTCYTATNVVSSVEDKQSLHRQGFDLVDMESYFVYQELKDTISRFYTFRIILDTAADHLPDLSDTVKKDGDISILKTLVHIAKKPQHLPSLIHLGKVTPKLTAEIGKLVEHWVNAVKDKL